MSGVAARSVSLIGRKAAIDLLDVARGEGRRRIAGAAQRAGEQRRRRRRATARWLRWTPRAGPSSSSARSVGVGEDDDERADDAAP